MSLQEEIDKTRKEIKTDSYSMSIGELINLYENNEIEIHPDFQRFFRWTNYQKSTFIESIILGIPVPPIFVTQREDGVWDVVDGLQRLSTIYEFVGVLADKLNYDEQLDENKSVFFELQETVYLPSFKGKKWNDEKDPENSLTMTQRLLIKRARLTVNIVEKESDSMVKYELFQRLNRGGSIATAQEVRNCIVLMLNKELYELMRSLANRPAFKNCIALSDRLYEEQYDMELVLRFMLLFDKNEHEFPTLKGDVSDFLTSSIRDKASEPNWDSRKIQQAFDVTFDLLNQTLGDNSFKRYRPEDNRFLGGFLLSAYEVIALGIGYHYQNPINASDVSDKIKSIWTHKTYQKWSGAGVNATRRLPHLIKLGREVFSPQ